MLISVRIFMPTLSFREVPPCSPESVSVCPRRSPLWHLLPLRLRLWPHQSVSTPCGLEGLFWHLFLPSRACGSRRRSMMSLVQALFTGSASKKVVFGITIDILNKCFGEKRKDGVLWSSRRRI